MPYKFNDMDMTRMGIKKLSEITGFTFVKSGPTKREYKTEAFTDVAIVKKEVTRLRRAFNPQYWEVKLCKQIAHGTDKMTYYWARLVRK